MMIPPNIPPPHPDAHLRHEKNRNEAAERDARKRPSCHTGRHPEHRRQNHLPGLGYSIVGWPVVSFCVVVVVEPPYTKRGGFLGPPSSCPLGLIDNC